MPRGVAKKGSHTGTLLLFLSTEFHKIIEMSTLQFESYQAGIIREIQTEPTKRAVLLNCRRSHFKRIL